MSWPFPERNLGSLCCEIAIFANGSLSGLDKDLDKKEASRGKKTTCAVHYQTHYRYLATISCCFLIFGMSDCAFPGVVLFQPLVCRTWRKRRKRRQRQLGKEWKGGPAVQRWQRQGRQGWQGSDWRQGPERCNP